MFGFPELCNIASEQLPQPFNANCTALSKVAMLKRTQYKIV